MNITNPDDLATVSGEYACLMPPQLRGLAAIQARVVDKIKRAAIRQLHASRRGEHLLLRMYLTSEETTEMVLQKKFMPDPPAWLARQVEQHLADEQRHADLFAATLRACGDHNVARLRPDWLTRRKMARWQRLAKRYAQHFTHGLLIPAYATGLCAEQMGMRVLHRHCETIGARHPLYPLLSQVLSDERRHVRLCSYTLQRMVAPSEASHLAALLAEVRVIDASFGISGALAMYVIGRFHRVLAGVRQGAQKR